MIHAEQSNKIDELKHEVERITKRAKIAASVASTLNLEPKSDDIQRLVELVISSDFEYETIIRMQINNTPNKNGSSDMRVATHRFVQELPVDQLFAVYDFITRKLPKHFEVDGQSPVVVPEEFKGKKSA